ncbi:MAG: RNA-guided endonuclease TnpB family protein [Microcoleus sp.]
MTLKAFSYRFYPTPEQESLLRRTIGCVRLVYNQAASARTQAWYQEQKRVGYTETNSILDVENEALPASDNRVGTNLGITSLLALSTGEKIANPKGFKAKYRKLTRAQKALSRKQKGSNNRHKARLKVARVHQSIADARKDNLHKLTTRLVRENQTIAVEDLAVKNMVKNPKLALALSDASWGELVRQLEYKCDWYGHTLIKIDRWFPSSKRCFECGYIVEKLPLKIRKWECPNCGAHHDRDLNASKKILAAGLAVKVCGATVRPEQSKSVKAGAKNPSGRKQKPKS